MKLNLSPTPHAHEPFVHNWGWFLGWGIVLSLLGIAAITASVFTTWLSMVMLGWLMLISGSIILVDSFHYWWSKESGFSLHFIMGALYIVFGLLCIFSPMIAAATFTLLLAILFIIIGLSRLFYALSFKLPGWGWNLVSALLSLLLGILIIIQWPASSLFIIGMFIGIDLFFLGWSYIMVSMFARRSK